MIGRSSGRGSGEGVTAGVGGFFERLPLAEMGTRLQLFKRIIRLNELNGKAPQMTTNLAEQLMAIRPSVS
jgi:hypothetical protein